MSDHHKKNEQSYLTAAQATQALGIKAATLYTYVSRGLIRSIVQPTSRARMYYREDVERAGQRMGGRAGMPETAQAVLSWGHPIFHTAITDITENGPAYRGRLARRLADSNRSFESVAELLWSGIDRPQLSHWRAMEPPPLFVRRLESILAGTPELNCLRILSLATSLLAAEVPIHPDFERGSTIPDARLLLTVYAAALGFAGPHRQFVSVGVSGGTLAEIFIRAAGVATSASNVQAVNTTMILCADHELSPASLAARVAASSGSALHACLLAAIGTHSGTALAGGCNRIEVLLRGARDANEMHKLMSQMAHSGMRIPGYNLRAYPRGDPRARQLLDLAASLGAGAERIARLVEGVETRFDLQPSLEVGLIALAAAIDLPVRMAAGLWSVARAAGWVAHVIEQRQAAFMVRPRARYIGSASDAPSKSD